MKQGISNEVITVLENPNIKTSAGNEVHIMEGLQPFLFCSSKGTLVIQAQLNMPPYNTKGKMTYPSALATYISRHSGDSWYRFIHKPNEDEVNLEGGVAELSDGTIIMLDTYVVPSGNDGEGIGELWISKDDWYSLQGPFNVKFIIPGINFYGSTDDGGRGHEAGRLHRSIIECPNGDLLTIMYCIFKQDKAPCSYTPSMLKSRSILIRSKDRGQTWEYVSTIASDSGIGTEGFTEPVIVRISGGKYEGRLICMMRTGRELYEAHSDDNGETWSIYKPVVFDGINIYDKKAWMHLFKDMKSPILDKYPEMSGAVVDPDIIEMENGVLVCAFGVRIPEKACWACPDYERNGNYLAFSLDQGDTWSDIIQLTSGVMTTHYMGVREINPNELFVVYDLGAWGNSKREIVGRKIKVEI